MSWMHHPETHPFAVIHDAWPMFSGLLLTGVTTTPGLVDGSKSLVTLPVKSIGAALAAGACSPSRISNATFHVYKRRGTMTSLLPRMVSSSRGCRPRHDVYVCRDDLARKSGDQRVASDRHAATWSRRRFVSHLRSGSKDPGSAKLIRRRPPSVPLPSGAGFPERTMARCRYSLDCCKLFARGAAVGVAPKPSDTPASPWNSLIIGNY